MQVISSKLSFGFLFRHSRKQPRTKIDNWLGLSPRRCPHSGLYAAVALGRPVTITVWLPSIVGERYNDDDRRSPE